MQIETITEDLIKGKDLVEKWSRTGLLKKKESFYQKMDMAFRLEHLMTSYLNLPGPIISSKSLKSLFEIQAKLDSKHIQFYHRCIFIGDKPRRWNICLLEISTE